LEEACCEERRGDDRGAERAREGDRAESVRGADAGRVGAPFVDGVGVGKAVAFGVGRGAGSRAGAELARIAGRRALDFGQPL